MKRRVRPAGKVRANYRDSRRESSERTPAADDRWIRVTFTAEDGDVLVMLDRELFEMGGDDAARILFYELKIAAKIGRRKPNG
jgi:hypothetical protein